MTVIVTGGAGFIGARLAERLLREDAERQLVIVDDFSTGSRENLKFTEGSARVKIIESDVADFDFTALDSVDRVYHLACPASRAAYASDALRTMDTSYLGTRNALNAARFFGARFLFTSSSEVYGDPDIHPQHEAYEGKVSTTTGRSCYAEGKRIAETLCYHYSSSFPVTIVRLFNVYGPSMDINDDRVIPTFVRSALLGRDLTVHGDGSQTSCFCHIDDAVEALARILEGNLDGLKVLNVGGDEEVAMLELAQRIANTVIPPAGIVFSPGVQADPRRRMPDTRRLRAQLNWEPRVGLAEGLARMFDHYSCILPAAATARDSLDTS